MSGSEILLAVGAFALLGAGGWLGWRRGFVAQLRWLAITAFALLFSVRYWNGLSELAARGVGLDPRVLAVAAFVALFAVGSGLAALAIGFRRNPSETGRNDPRSAALGAVAGVVTGLLVAAAVVRLAGLALPERFDSAGPLRALAAWPGELCEGFERHVAGIAADSPQRTRLPAADAAGGVRWE